MTNLVDVLMTQMAEDEVLAQAAAMESDERGEQDVEDFTVTATRRSAPSGW